MTRRSRSLGILFLMFFAFSLALGSTTSPANADAPCVQMGSFVKSAAYIVAQREGLFAQEGVQVCYNQITSSAQGFSDFLSGKYQFITAASDNMVNRFVNSNQPISMIAGIEKGADQVLAVNTANGINSIADLRGKAIAVDAPDSGFVFVLRKILAASGLYLERGDYSFQLIGGTPLRFNALTAGTFKGQPVYATMLVYPFTARVQAPVKVVAKASDFVTPYQSAAIAVTHAYANSNSATVTAFLRAFIKGHQFARRPENRATVIAHMAAELGVTPAIAEANLDVSLDKETGENRSMHMSKKGLTNTVKLRQEFNGFTQPLDDKEIRKLVKPTKNGLYDATYWQAAMRSLGESDDESGDDD